MTKSKMPTVLRAKLEAAAGNGASGSYGAVACIRNVKNPVHATRSVIDGAGQKFLVGEIANKFAQESGLKVVPRAYFTTTARKAHLQSLLQRSCMACDYSESVSTIALDLSSDFAAAG